MKVNILRSGEALLSDKAGAADDFFTAMEKLFEKTLEDTARLPDVVSTAEISLSFLSPEEMAAVNLKFRGIDSDTDVLSFPLWEEDSEFTPPLDWEELALGDIIVCPDAVEKNAADNDKEFLQELVLVLSHGLLHLVGFDHDCEDTQGKMWELQDSMVKSFMDGRDG
jgi:probable rRNA maturation factor